MPWICGKESVLSMNSAHQMPNYIHSVDRISISIHNQIGAVQVHKYVVQAHILNHSQQGDGCFLAGFAKEQYSALFAIAGNVLHRCYRLRIEGIVWIFWNEATRSEERRAREEERA